MSNLKIININLDTDEVETKRIFMGYEQKWFIFKQKLIMMSKNVEKQGIFAVKTTENKKGSRLAEDEIRIKNLFLQYLLSLMEEIEIENQLD